MSLGTKPLERKNWGQTPISGNRALTPIFCVFILLTGCGTGGQALRDDPQFARSIADTAARAAVAKPGARVCREMQVGIAERDWVRGLVVEVKAAQIAVRIDEPGRFEHIVNGVKVTLGAIVVDDAVSWTPCL